MITLISPAELVPQADLEKSQSRFVAVLNEEMLWKLVSHADAFVRRSLCRLLVVSLNLWAQILNPSVLSTHILATGLHTSQAGSSLDYIKAIVRLSENLPTVWTSDYKGTGKKSAHNRLLQFLRKGSQGGPAEYWIYVSQLLKLVPSDTMFNRSYGSQSERAPNEYDVLSLPVLEALQAGVNNKDEPRANSAPAWTAFLSVCEITISTEKDLDKPRFLRSYLLPFMCQYVRPSPDRSQWTVAGFQQQDNCAKACRIVLHGDRELFEREWHIISSKIVEDFQTSLPEQSKDYTKSQDSIAAEAMRWYRMQAALVEGLRPESIIPIISRDLVQEIAAAISVLKARNGKPYGSAAALQTALRSMPKLIFSDGQMKDALIDFVDKDIPRLITSPSATYLIRLLDLMEGSMDTHSVYLNCLQNVDEASESAARQTAIRTLLSSTGFAKAGLLSLTANKSLAQAIDHALKAKDNSGWSLLAAALSNAAAPKGLTDDVLTVLAEGLSIESNCRASLYGLELTTKQDRTAIRDFVAQSKGSNLVSKLLFLSDSSDIATSQRAKNLLTEIEEALSTTGNVAQTTRPIFKAIQREFETAGPDSLS